MKKYTASTMAEALAAVRAELGPRAVILHSSTSRKGLPGLGKAVVEVVAAVEEAAKPKLRALPPAPAVPARATRPAAARPAPAATRPAPGSARSNGTPNRMEPSPYPRPSGLEAALRGRGDDGAANGHAGRAMDLVRAIAEGQQPVQPAAIREMQEHVKEMRGAIGRMIQHSQWPGLTKLAAPLADLYQRLLDQEVEPALAQELATTVDSELSLQASGDRATVLDCLAKHLRRMLPTSGPLLPTPGEPTIVFLIGPTGVGKTTTIAKLAATLTMQRHSVALVTCDTYRIAAIPQLRTYADILRLPLDVAYSPEELTAKVMDQVERDFIIVDTPGRSQRNADQLAELRQFVTAVPSRRTFVTVTAGARYKDMLDVVARFGAIGFDGLLATKLDETTSYGPLLNLIRQTGKPLTYVTNGQNVPKDIQLATSPGLTDLLIGAAYAPERGVQPALAGGVA